MQSRTDTVLLLCFIICCFQMEQDTKANQAFFCRCRALSSNFLSAKASYQTVSKELPCGSDWSGQKWWGLWVSCLWRSSKFTRERTSEKKYYLQFTSENEFYLHSSKWFVAHWGMDLLNLSLVSPEAGDPWSVICMTHDLQPMMWADRQGNIPAGKSCLGWVDWTLVSDKEQLCQVFPRAIVIFLSFHLNKLVHSML